MKPRKGISEDNTPYNYRNVVCTFFSWLFHLFMFLKESWNKPYNHCPFCANLFSWLFHDFYIISDSWLN